MLPSSSLYALAQHTGVAFSWVHDTISELQARGWVAENAPMRVIDAGAIFNWWNQNRRPPTLTSLQVQDAHLTAHQLGDAGKIPNAVTTYYAENWYQKHLFPRRLDTYVPADRVIEAKRWLVEHGALIGGVNFRLWSADAALVEDAIPGPRGPMQLHYAPIPQVIVDLMWEGGSAKEAAEMMIQGCFRAA